MAKEKNVWFPVDRFLAVIENAGVTREELETIGLLPVWMHDLRRQEAIKLSRADEILTALGLSDWFHIPAAQGGLAELYEEDEVFTPRWVERACAQLEVLRARREKLTPEQQRERNRAKARRSAERKKTPCVDCGTRCSGKRCHACYVKSVESPHGLTRYAGPHRCRCDVCRAAASKYHRERRARMRAAYEGRAA